MAKAKQHREPLQSGGKLDNVIKDYMWQQRHTGHDLVVLKSKGIDPFNKAGTHYKKVVPVMARVFNPKTGKVELVNIREHNKKVLSGKKKKN